VLVPTREIRSGAALDERYQLGELLGGGSHALVYRGRHLNAGRDVAIKILRATAAQKPVVRERFLREARAANRIRHANVIDVTDVGTTDDDQPFLVMELLEGESLRTQLGSPWPEERVVWLGTELALALAAGHALGVVHRDLSPDNIVVLGERRLKVVDFGLAKLEGERRLTASALMVGTPRYMAPEQIRGAEVSDRTDVYALSCILFEAVSGAPVFDGSGPQVMAAHLKESAPAVPDGVPRGLASLIARGLAKSPDDRPSAADIVATLSGGRAPRAQPRSSSPTDHLHQRRELLVRLLAYLHPTGDVPDTIAEGLRDVRRCILGDKPFDTAPLAAVHQRIRAELAEPFGAIDTSAMRRLAELGSLAERWLSLEESRVRSADPRPAPTPTEAHAVLDAIERYIQAHPEGMGLLPDRREPRP